jgi:hypothetical protein
MPRRLAHAYATEGVDALRNEDEEIRPVGDRGDAFDCIGRQLERVDVADRAVLPAEELQVAAQRIVLGMAQVEKAGIDAVRRVEMGPTRR